MAKSVAKIAVALLALTAVQACEAEPPPRKETCVAFYAAAEDALEEFVTSIVSDGQIDFVKGAEAHAAKIRTITVVDPELKKPGEAYAAVLVKAAKDASKADRGRAIFAGTTVNTSDAYRELDRLCAEYAPQTPANN